jgi:hypothetical protein
MQSWKCNNFTLIVRKENSNLLMTHTWLLLVPSAAKFRTHHANAAAAGRCRARLQCCNHRVCPEPLAMTHMLQSAMQPEKEAWFHLQKQPLSALGGNELRALLQKAKGDDKQQRGQEFASSPGRS